MAIATAPRLTARPPSLRRVPGSLCLPRSVPSLTGQPYPSGGVLQIPRAVVCRDGTENTTTRQHDVQDPTRPAPTHRRDPETQRPTLQVRHDARTHTHRDRNRSEESQETHATATRRPGTRKLTRFRKDNIQCDATSQMTCPRGTCGSQRGLSTLA